MLRLQYFSITWSVFWENHLELYWTINKLSNLKTKASESFLYMYYTKSVFWCNQIKFNVFWMFLHLYSLPNKRRSFICVICVCIYIYTFNLLFNQKQIISPDNVEKIVLVKSCRVFSILELRNEIVNMFCVWFFQIPCHETSVQ